MSTHFGEKIELIRKAEDISQAELCLRIEVSLNTYRGIIKRGNSARIEVLEKIAKTWPQYAYWLATGDVSPPNHISPDPKTDWENGFIKVIGVVPISKLVSINGKNEFKALVGKDLYFDKEIKDLTLIYDEKNKVLNALVMVSPDEGFLISGDFLSEDFEVNVDFHLMAKLFITWKLPQLIFHNSTYLFDNNIFLQGESKILSIFRKDLKSLSASAFDRSIELDMAINKLRFCYVEEFKEFKSNN